MLMRGSLGLISKMTIGMNSAPDGSAMLMRDKSVTHFEDDHRNELRPKWLGHADARQVSDLPDGHLQYRRSMTVVRR